MRRAAIAEEAILVGIGIEAQRLDIPHARRRDARDDIGFDIELVMARPAIGEEELIGRIRRAEAREEAVVDLV
jgi:hypothetical protein